jgi:glycosyltransferase involved in cell wall biosynthesis
MRVVALLATYNEERFILRCLEHLFEHGVEVYLIDNSSTDQTVPIAERYLTRGLIGIEHFPRDGIYKWRALLERKQQLASTLDADWLIHVDADEIRLPPRTGRTLVQALADVDRQGFNAVNFLDFTFVPTREAPDHDHPNFQETMRWYYPFQPRFPHKLTAWRRQDGPIELAWSAGHRVRFPGLRMSPESFRMRHYLFVSVPHAISKFVDRCYDEAELRAGWHRWRAALQPEMIKLPAQGELRTYLSDDELDPSNPRSRPYLADLVAAHDASA